MSDYECIDRLGIWEGYRVAAVERFEVAEVGGRSVNREYLPLSHDSMDCQLTAN